MKRILLVGLTGVLSLAGLGQGQALAAVTVGSNLSHAPDNMRCDPTDDTLSCTMVQTSLPGPSTAPGGLTSPIDGVVVRWRIELGGHTPQTSAAAGRLRVLRGNLGADSGSSENLLLSAGTYTFPTRLPVRSGDRIGLDATVSGSSCGGLCGLGFVHVGTGTGTFDSWSPPLADGETRAPTNNPDTELLLNADIEPDADHDGFGDETQDGCPGVVGSVNGCPQADLGLTKAASQGSESDLVSYTLVARNNGPDAMPSVAVADALPSGAAVVSANGPSGPCTVTGGSVVCQVGTLASGASATITIVARLKAGTQTNTATISSPVATQAAAHGAADPSPANNTASATVSVSAPAVSKVSVFPSTFLAGSALPHFLRRSQAGTTISFSLSEPANATLAFSQPKPGRKVGRRCVAPLRSNRRKRHCTRQVTVGRLTFKAQGGLHNVRFQGRLSRRKALRPGRYTVTITATDSAGNRSRPRTATFTIVSR